MTLKKKKLIKHAFENRTNKMQSENVPRSRMFVQSNRPKLKKNLLNLIKILDIGVLENNKIDKNIPFFGVTHVKNDFLFCTTFSLTKVWNEILSG